MIYPCIYMLPFMDLEVKFINFMLTRLATVHFACAWFNQLAYKYWSSQQLAFSDLLYLSCYRANYVWLYVYINKIFNWSN